MVEVRTYGIKLDQNLQEEITLRSESANIPRPSPPTWKRGRKVPQKRKLFVIRKVKNGTDWRARHRTLHAYKQAQRRTYGKCNASLIISLDASRLGGADRLISLVQCAETDFCSWAPPQDRQGLNKSICAIWCRIMHRIMRCIMHSPRLHNALRHVAKP